MTCWQKALVINATAGVRMSSRARWEWQNSEDVGSRSYRSQTTPHCGYCKCRSAARATYPQNKDSPCSTKGQKSLINFLISRWLSDAHKRPLYPQPPHPSRRREILRYTAQACVDVVSFAVAPHLSTASSSTCPERLRFRASSSCLACKVHHRVHASRRSNVRIRLGYDNPGP